MSRFPGRPWLFAAFALSASPVLAHTLHVVADTTTSSQRSTTVHGRVPTLEVKDPQVVLPGGATGSGWCGASGDGCRAFARFDLSSLPDGATVEKARLWLWVGQLRDAGTVEVAPVLGSWDEATLTGGTEPPLGDAVATVPLAAASQGEYVSVDVTSLVQGWVSGSVENDGLALSSSASDPVAAVLGSRENERPLQLEVGLAGVAGPPGPEGPPGPQGPPGPETALSGQNGILVTQVPGAATIASNATAANTAGAIVSRDANGSFAAGTLDLAGNLSLPATTASAGIINLGGTPFLHNYGVTNIFLGIAAGSLSTGGSWNNGMGTLALHGNTTGDGNTAVGDIALSSNTTGSYNSAFGAAALTNGNADYNAAFGAEALQQNTTGSYNAAFGAWTLVDNGSGSGNVAVGYRALVLGHGSDNVAIGRSASEYVNGNRNISIGAYAGCGGDDNICIGSSTGWGGEIRIGGVQTAAYIAGIYGRTSTGGVPVYVNADGQLGTLTSATPFEGATAGMAVEGDAVTALREQVQEQRRTIEELKERIARLEAALAAAR